MNYSEILNAKRHNEHYLKRYCKLIELFKDLNSSGDIHHICPKAKDMFPEYTDASWNKIVVTSRQHFILHWILAKVFPGTSQTLAFFYMTNTLKKRKGKDYQVAREKQVEIAKLVGKDLKRNAKISSALKGKPKSAEHIASMMGHIVTEDTRQKLRDANLGKKHSEESKQKMSESRTGKTKKPLSADSKQNIAKSKMQNKLQTPRGVFHTFVEVATEFNISTATAMNIFRCLDKKPRPVTLTKLGITYTGPKSYREYGFDRLPI